MRHREELGWGQPRETLARQNVVFDAHSLAFGPGSTWDALGITSPRAAIVTAHEPAALTAFAAIAKAVAGEMAYNAYRFRSPKGDSGLHIQFGAQVITRCKMVPLRTGDQMKVILQIAKGKDQSSMAGLFEVKGDCG